MRTGKNANENNEVGLNMLALETLFRGTIKMRPIEDGNAKGKQQSFCLIRSLPSGGVL